MVNPQIEVKVATPADAEGILNAHYSAVHGTAAHDYPASILQEWSPRVDHERIERYIKRSLPTETTLVALIKGEIAGFGAIVEAKNELRAIYVHSSFRRMGVATRLLQDLETLAKARGCRGLGMDSSLTAEPFYLKQGYQVIERAQHRLSSGAPMACVRMWKSLL